MKKARKGFTLVELMIVIGIMGTLGAMAMIGGQEAANAAKATNIADNLEKVSIAMMAYYADNAATIDKSGTTNEKVTKGTQAYLKSGMIATSTAATDSAAAKASETEGTYSVVITKDNDSTAKWYAAYTLLSTTTEPATGNVAQILESKADRMQLKAGVGDSAAAYTAAADNTTIYMLVR